MGIIVSRTRRKIMPRIIPIRDLKNTTAISEMAHLEQEPIFVTKNGYSDLVIMSAELYEQFTQMNRIDAAIAEAEQEVSMGAKPIEAEFAFDMLEKKYFG